MQYIAERNTVLLMTTFTPRVLSLYSLWSQCSRAVLTLL